MDDDPRRIVERGYDLVAERYLAEAIAGRGEGSPFRSFLDRLLPLVPSGGRVLDLGCGAGLLAAELMDRATVVGVDLSSRQLALARSRAPAARLVRADLAEVAFGDGSFDVVTAFWSLIHVPRERHREVLDHIRRWLRDGGVFTGTLGVGDNPAERDAFLGAPMYWSHFDEDANRRLLRSAGFRVLRAEATDDGTERWLWIVATTEGRSRSGGTDSPVG